MELRLLNNEEVSVIYNDYMLKDFPREELKSLKKIIRLTDEKKYFSYGVYEDNCLVGYALFMTYENIILLDYFAIIKEKRGNGAGSKVINLLSDYFKDKYDVFILESENPKFSKNESDKNIREKRIKFYEKNGLIKTDIKSKVYGVDFVIFIKNDKIKNNAKIVELLNNLYISMANEEKWKENVFISL